MVPRRDALCSVKREQRAKKCSVVSSSQPHRQVVEGQFRNPWLNLWSLRSLKSTLNFIKIEVPALSMMLKKPFLGGIFADLYNFLKCGTFRAFFISSGSNCHLSAQKGKNEFLKRFVRGWKSFILFFKYWSVWYYIGVLWILQKTLFVKFWGYNWRFEHFWC